MPRLRQGGTHRDIFDAWAEGKVPRDGGPGLSGVESRPDDLEATLARQEVAWSERPVLRRLYRTWYRLLVERLADGPGPSIELGSGIGRLDEVSGGRITLTDVRRTRWVDEQVDALDLPFGDRSLANIVMLDVFHHLPDAPRFLDEAQRALNVGGRVVMIEPYCSPLSYALYRRFHEERTDMRANPFDFDAASARDPFASNQALPTLMFFRHRTAFAARWPSLSIVETKRFAYVLYPLSGGYSRRSLVPLPLYQPLDAFERLLRPLGPLAAFRCLVVLEKTG